MTASRPYCAAFTRYHLQVCCNHVEVCQWRRSDTSTRALCPSGGCPWSPTTMVHAKSLHSTASSSDLYRTCSVEQSTTSLQREYVTGYIPGETENISFHTMTMTHEDHLVLLHHFRDF